MAFSFFERLLTNIVDVATAPLGPIGGAVTRTVGQSLGAPSPAGRQTAPSPAPLAVPPRATQVALTPANFAPTAFRPPVLQFPRPTPRPMPQGPGPLMPFAAPGPGGSCGSTSVTGLIVRKAKAATGMNVTHRQIVDAAQTCGIEMAAAANGLTTEEVCMLVMKRPRRRARGVSARDVRTARRVVRFARGITKDLTSTRTVTRTRKGC